MAIVLALAEQGANIVIDYVSHPEATEELEQRVHKLGDQAIGVDADVSKVADLQRLVDAAVKAFGRVDVMVTTRASRRGPRSSTPPKRTTRRSSRSTSRARSSAPRSPPSR
jgi:NAD(P)-dependent dehydrogenase (short-subunit alcohol dehydrogenase family)